jgi:hypothetical protein
MSPVRELSSEALAWKNVANFRRDENVASRIEQWEFWSF